MRSSGDLKAAARHGKLRFGLIVVTVALALAAILCSVLSLRYQRGLILASRYNVTFDLGQTAAEILRLQVALADTASPEALANVRLRYAILSNRTRLLGAESWGYDLDLSDMPAELRQMVAAIGPLIDSLPDAAAAAEARARLDPFVRPVLQLASRSHSVAGDAVSANQAELGWLFGVLTAITVALVAFGAGLIFFVSRQNRRLDRLVRIDALTGIANRFAFGEGLAAPGEERALVLVDVDHFKTLNDTLGHHGGDHLLKDLSRRLHEAASGEALIARIGGDEFGLLFDGPGAAPRALRVADRVIEAMREPVRISGQEVRASVTLGFSQGEPDVAASPEMLLENADIALYAAKAAGRNRCVAFDPALKRDFLRRQRLRKDLFGAIDRGELRLVFQPIIDLSSEAVAGYETLLRWRHPELGDIPPTEFIPVAEESGEILPIGRWVLREACRTAASWPRDVFVAVNVSAHQLADELLVGHIARCLVEHGLARGQLEIEVTESVLIGDAQLAFDRLERMRALGCRVALDDFGTGYASLGYLGRFPLDKLKIDRVFLKGGSENGPGVAIMTAICGLARKLGLAVVAEGVETADHVGLVRGIGCDLGQGYLFGRPAPAPEAPVAAAAA